MPDPLFSAVQGKDEILHKALCICPWLGKGGMEPLRLLILLFVTGRIPSVPCVMPSLPHFEHVVGARVVGPGVNYEGGGSPQHA